MSVESIIGILSLAKGLIMRLWIWLSAMLSGIKKRWSENRKARDHFDEFKTVTLSFEDIFISEVNPLIGLLDALNVEESHLSKVQIRLGHRIDQSFRCYRKRLERFDDTKEDFELLVDEFENIFSTFVDLFVKPLEDRSDKIASNDVIKKDFNEFVGNYDHLRRKYVDYGGNVNKIFGTNVVRTDFRQVLLIT